MEVMKSPNPRDLEVIVSLLEMAAISLSTIEKPEFTKLELFSEAREYAGKELALIDGDMDIVLRHSKFLKKTRNNSYKIF